MLLKVYLAACHFFLSAFEMGCISFILCVSCLPLAAAVGNCTLCLCFTEGKTEQSADSLLNSGTFRLSCRTMASAQRYQDKVVIVTGGSKGIGRGIVKVFGEFCLGGNKERRNELKSWSSY